MSLSKQALDAHTLICNGEAALFCEQISDLLGLSMEAVSTRLGLCRAQDRAVQDADCAELAYRCLQVVQILRGRGMAGPDILTFLETGNPRLKGYAPKELLQTYQGYQYVDTLAQQM